MRQIPIFEAERAIAGLAEKIQANSSICYESVIEKAASQILPEKYKKRSWAKATNEGQFDLHYLKSILVTTCWNRNDDIFTPLDVWSARATAEDKPFNYKHDCSDIIGHITACYAVDDEGALIADDTAIDALPAKFHIASSAVLYKFWSKSELQERMDEILSEIDDGKWFVSMECLFAGFDYALKSEDGDCQLVERNKVTAFLTKHLHAYGGDGVYDGKKVGRVLRDFVFSGKGLVSKPANPESIIFADVESFASASTIYEISESKNKLVYSSASESQPETKKEESKAKMADVNLEAELTAANSKIAELEKSIAALKDGEVKRINDELAASNATNKTLADEIEKSKASIKTLNDELTASKAQVTTLETEKKAVADELAEAKAAQLKLGRLKVVAEKLKFDDAKAEKFVTSLASLSDEAFASHVDEIATSIAAVNTPAPAPPKSTTAASAPKSTPAPSVVTAAVLDTAEPEKTANPVSTSAEVNTLSQAVASFFEDDKSKKK